MNVNGCHVSDYWNVIALAKTRSPDKCSKLLTIPVSLIYFLYNLQRIQRMIYLCTARLKSKPEETTILRSRSVIFVSRWGWHEGSTNCSVCVSVALLNTTFCLHVVYQPRRPFSCQRKQSSARLTT